MRCGLQISKFTWPGGASAIGPTFKRAAQDAEAAGLSSLWVMDHFFQIHQHGPPEMDMLEGYTALAFAAAATERIELGTLATGVTYRHPGLLAKTVTTLDVLSGGRAWLGIGAAWNEEEHLGLGVPFPPLKERFERLEESLHICRQMFDGDESRYAGTHFTLERPLNVPAPLRRTPILIGGSGPKKTLRLFAKYADACSLFDAGPDAMAARLAILRGHCDDLGRDPRDIEVTALSRLLVSRTGGTSPRGNRIWTVDEAIDHYGRLAEVGLDHVIWTLPDVSDHTAYEVVADIVRQLEPVAAGEW
ncbi:LLM class F420-dependent oxidoreductase [Knoellia subterranea]|uniref:Luciferase n=1 Tax=Knoellia subterranea KCTC 19937 TaxID=1385521 RepID=A0A0A0JPW3_9MICO|nr:LLM class F420-dependent oxidoreductase [Knoellia subterranea]KGN39203.1 luciferase [Knoellia subterranea KCTC 19937]